MPDKPQIKQHVVTAFSPDFFGEDVQDWLQKAFNRTGVSYHKYGPLAENFPDNRTGIDQVKQRVALYEETGNLEWVVDALNYCLIELLLPSHPDAHFRATDSDESPGAVNKDGSVHHGRD